ncbi:MAG: LamG domain-containing protein [Lentisphaeria bacterium]|nr:LamG domain-containing protein [Lentisphaeria bacterium]
MAITRLKHFAAIFLTAALLPLAGAEKILFWSFDTADALPDTPGASWIGKKRGECISDGTHGKVLRVGTDKSGSKILSAAVTLPVKSGLNTGCVSFKVKPEDWDGNQKDFRNFIDLGNDAGEKLSIYRLHNSKGVFIVTLMRKDGKRADAGFDMSNWKKGQWYHLAVCWDPQFIQIYQNGKLMRKTPVKGFRFSHPFSTLETGKFIKTYNGGHMRMDDITLYNAALSREEAENITQPPSPGILVNGRIRMTTDPKTGSFTLIIPESGRKISSAGMPLFSFRLFDENARKANNKPLNGKGHFWGTPLVMNGKEITSSDCKFLRMERPADNRAVMVWQHPAAEVKVFFEVTEHGLKQYAELTNTGKDPIYEFVSFSASLDRKQNEHVVVPFPPRIGLEFSKLISYTWAMNYAWDGFIIRKKDGGLLAFDRCQDIEKQILPGWGNIRTNPQSNKLEFTGKTTMFVRPGEKRSSIAVSIRNFSTIREWADHYRDLNFPSGIKTLSQKLTKEQFDKFSRAYLAPTWATIRGAISIVDRAPGVYIVHPPIYMHHCKGQRSNWDAFPNYFPPAKRVGTMADFEVLIKNTVRSGGIFMPRTSFYYWGCGSDFDLAYGLEKNAIVRIDGKPRTAMWAQPGYMVSPSSRQVLNYLDEIFNKWKKLGINAYFTNVIGAQLPDHNSFDFHPDAPGPDLFYSQLFKLHKKYGQQIPLLSEDGAFWSMPYQVGICGYNPWLSPVPGNLEPKGTLVRPAPEFALYLMHEYIRFYTSNTNFLNAASSPRALATSLTLGTGLKAGFVNENEMTREKRRWMRTTALIAGEIHNLNYGQRLNSYTEQGGIVTAVYGKNLNLANFSGKDYVVDAAGYKAVIAHNGFLFVSADQNRIAGFFKEFAGNKFRHPLLLVMIREGRKARIYAPLELQDTPIEIEGVKAVIPAYPAVIAKKIPGIRIDFVNRSFTADPVIPDTAILPRSGSAERIPLPAPEAGHKTILTWQTGEKLPAVLQHLKNDLNPVGLHITRPVSFDVEGISGKIAFEIGIKFNRYPEEPKGDSLPLLSSGSSFKLFMTIYTGRLHFSSGKSPAASSWGMAFEPAVHNMIKAVLNGKEQLLTFNKRSFKNLNSNLFPSGKSSWLLGFNNCDFTITSIRISTF